MAVGGVRPGRRPAASHRRADGRQRRRSGRPGAPRRLARGPQGAWLGRWRNGEARSPLGGRRDCAHSRAGDRDRGRKPRHHRCQRHRRCQLPSPGDADNSRDLRAGGRSRRLGLHRQPGPAGWQHDRLHLLRSAAGRQMVPAPEGGVAGCRVDQPDLQSEDGGLPLQVPGGAAGVRLADQACAGA